MNDLALIPFSNHKYNMPMPLRNILCYPDEQLRRKSKQVTDFDQSLQTLIDDMFATMENVEAIGLAAIQVGIPLRLAVINVEEPLTIINPTINIIDATPTPYEEGCLSLPGIKTEISRPSFIQLNALDRNGKPFELKTDGLLAVCAQHEIDHMDGALLIDKLSPLKRNQVNSQLRNLIALYKNQGAP